MPTHAELVGPFPPGVEPEDYDRRRRRILWMLPTGLYLLGARSGEERNFMTANLVTQVATVPKLVGVAVESEAVTHRLVRASGQFSLNLLERGDRAIVRAFARPAAHDAAAATLNGERYRDAKVTGAPLLGSALAWLDCVLAHELDLGSHTLFIGEVVDADSRAEEGSEVLRMEDTRMNYGG